jgi:PAS domain S-box-containing protein
MAAVLSQFASLGLHKSRTLASLATSHQRFRWLIETASDAIVSIDASGRIVYWNTASEELFQHGRSDIVGQPITQVLPDGIGESLSGGADATSGRTHETVGRRRDGTEFPIELSIASYELEGERFLTGIIRSIVERKQAERALRESHEELERRVQRRTAELMLTNESLRREIADRKRAEDLATRFGQILNESLNEIYFVDANTLRFLKVNQGALSNLGYSLEELQQFSVLDIQPGMSTEALEACVAPLRAGMEQRVQFTSLHRRKDGTTYPVEVHLQLSSLDSSPVFVAMVLDITRRKELEEQANRHQSELAHVSRLSTMGEMGSAIAHELNQPLCAILSYAQATLRMMRSDKPDEADVMDALEQTAAQAKRAGEIIRHLKDFSRKREPHRSSINVNDVITEAIHFIAAETRSAAASIELQFAAELPMVLGDTIEIEQVVVNLARNAVEAMADLPPEQRRLVIHTWSGDEESVEVAFRDNGPGLPPEDVGRVFDPFYSTKAEGMGIGLSISRTIIEAHGGRLWATLNDEQGTTFRISLPTKSKTERTA